jgi:hypothetical protein
MQRVVAYLRRGVGALTIAAGPKGVRKLGEREHTLAGVSLDRFFTDATQEAQVILSDGLVTTAIAELADPAVIIQQQLRRGLSALQSLGVSKEIFRNR